MVKIHYEMMRANPRIAEYLSSNQRLPPSGREGWVDTVKATLPHLFTGELYPMKSDKWRYDSSATPSPCDLFNVTAEVPSNIGGGVEERR